MYRKVALEPIDLLAHGIERVLEADILFYPIQNTCLSVVFICI